MPILRWNTDYRATATLGATRTLLQPLFGSSQTTSFHKFCTHTGPGSSLSQILTITILHGAQIEHQFERIRFGRRYSPRSSVDDIMQLKKNVYYGVTWELNRADFVSTMRKASKSYLVVDGLIATVTFAAGITMPGGFIGIEGSHQGSAVLTRNTAFRAFVITDTIAMVQSLSAIFIISLFMPLFFQEKHPRGFSFLVASMALCLTISAMGATVLAFVTGTYAVLMHSLDLAIAACVIGLCFFILTLFLSIGCSRYFRKMWKMVKHLFFGLFFKIKYLCY